MALVLLAPLVGGVGAWIGAFTSAELFGPDLGAAREMADSGHASADATVEVVGTLGLMGVGAGVALMGAAVGGTLGLALGAAGALAIGLRMGRTHGDGSADPS